MGLVKIKHNFTPEELARREFLAGGGGFVKDGKDVFIPADRGTIVIPIPHVCLYCVNSLSADSDDGSQVLVCFDREGHEGENVVVDEEGCCGNYKGE